MIMTTDQQVHSMLLLYAVQILDRTEVIRKLDILDLSYVYLSTHVRYSAMR